jgi:hypothetical protein
VLGHAVGVVFGHELEGLQELGFVQNLDLPLDLADHVLELVVDQQDAVAVLCVFDGLVGNGGR